MTAPIVKVMVANKLPATVLAQVFLLVIAGFAVSLYILPTATGTANGILSFHTSNIPCLRCFLFARRLSAYILGHHRNSFWIWPLRGFSHPLPDPPPLRRGGGFKLQTLLRIGQNGGCFRGHCFYRTKWRLLAFFDGEIILYKHYLIHLSHPVMTPKFAL